jgi:hypothetical protein
MCVWDAFPQKPKTKYKIKKTQNKIQNKKTQNKIQNKKTQNKTKILIEYVNNFYDRYLVFYTDIWLSCLTMINK